MPVPDCPIADYLEDWLEVLNALVDRRDAFPRGRRYEILALDPGSALYCLVLCPLKSDGSSP